MLSLFSRKPKYPAYRYFPQARHRKKAEKGLLSDRPDYFLSEDGWVGCTTCGGNCGQCGDSLATGAASMQALVNRLHGTPRPFSKKERARIRNWLAQWDAFEDA